MSTRVTIFAVLLLLAAINLTSCQGSSLLAAGDTAVVEKDAALPGDSANPPPHAAPFRLPFPADDSVAPASAVRRQVAGTEITALDGVQTWQRGGTTNEAGTQLVLEPAADEIAWAIYQFSGMADGDEVTNVAVEVSSPGPDNYWLGWADYNSESWIWQPRGDKVSSTSVDDVFEPPSGINPISYHGNVQVAVVAWDATAVDVYSVTLTAELYEVPVAKVVANPAIGNQDLTVTFDASMSYVRGGGAITEFEWDWDGEANGWNFESSGTDDSPQHTYTEPGSYQAVLRVTGPPNNTDLGMASVTVTGVAKAWGGAGSESANAIAVDEFGSIYLAGYENGYGGGGQDALLVKYSKNHSFAWARSIGDDSGKRDIYEGIAVADGRVYATGYTSSYGVEKDDVLLTCYNANGDLEWIRTWGGPEFEMGRGLAVSGDGYLYVSGHTRSFGNEAELLLLKLDLDGNLVWSKIWGGPANEFITGLALYDDSLIYVSGESASFGGGDTDALLVKYNSDGEKQWVRTWGGDAWDGFNSLALTVTGNVFCAGGSASFASGQPPDVLVMQFMDNGIYTWAKTVNFDEPDVAECMLVSGIFPMSLYVVGRANHSGIDYPQLWRFAADGSLEWSRYWLPQTADYQQAMDGAMTPDSRLLIAGNAVAAPGTWVVNPGYTTDNHVIAAQSVIGTEADASGTLLAPTNYISQVPEGTLDTGGGNSDVLLLECYPAEW